MNKVLIAAGVLAAALPVASASAATIVSRSVAVANASFENPALNDGQFCLGCTDGWYTTGGEAAGGANNFTANLVPVTPDGQNTGFINNWFPSANSSSSGMLFQPLSEKIAANTTYQLKLDVVRRADDYRFGGWFAELYSGNTVLASGTMSETEIALGGFKTLTVDYTAEAAFADQELGIRIRSVFDPNDKSFRQVNFDNVRLTATPSAAAAVPEPATWAMMLIGFGVVGGTMRRRTSHQARVTFA